MLNLFEFMWPAFLDTLNKYIANNKKSSWFLWIYSSNEYNLSTQKCKAAARLLEDMKKLFEEYNQAEGLSEAQGSEDQNLTDDYQRRSNSECLLNGNLETPELRRATSAALPSAALISQIHADILKQVASPSNNSVISTGRRLRELDGVLSISNTSHHSIAFISKAHKRLEDEIIDAKNIRAKYRPNTTKLRHKKGSYDALVSVFMGSLMYLSNRECDVWDNIESLDAVNTMRHFNLGREYREQLSLLIERLLCLIEFDKALYKHEELVLAKKELYALSGTVSSNDFKTIDEVVEELKVISARIYEDVIINKDQYIKICYDYECVEAQFKKLKGPIVAAYLQTLIDFKTSLQEEFKNKFAADLDTSKLHAERAMLSNTTFTQLGSEVSPFLSPIPIPAKF